MRRAAAVLLCFALLSGASMAAQTHEPALSNAEVEHLREIAYEPAERIRFFTEFLDDRIKGLQTLTTGKRKPGREQDMHQLLEEFASIADELTDNLDDFAKRNRDMRKALPKLASSLDRWQAAMNALPEDPAYNVSRRLALQSLGDLREDTTRLIPEQAAYFKAHPPGKDGEAAPPR